MASDDDDDYGAAGCDKMKGCVGGGGIMCTISVCKPELQKYVKQ